MHETGIGRIATVAGRYYAMDRDKRWERLEKSYAAIVYGQGEKAASAVEGVLKAYAEGVTDEFVEPFIVAGDARGRVKSEDEIIFFNFRPDRARQLTRAFVDKDFGKFDRPFVLAPCDFVCMTQYDATITAETAFPPSPIDNTLGEVLAKAGLRQLRLAETEKYAHVTFFFNGGEETPNIGEERILVPSPKVATYDLQPEMSAYLVTEELLAALDKNIYDVIILNFANPDMVGHTGVFSAAVKAMEAVDKVVGKIVRAVLSLEGIACITSDHGNVEKMKEDDGAGPCTAHTTNKVPFLLVGYQDLKGLRKGILADIAPTILDLLGLPKPKEMTGTSLIIK